MPQGMWGHRSSGSEATGSGVEQQKVKLTVAFDELSGAQRTSSSTRGPRPRDMFQGLLGSTPLIREQQEAGWDKEQAKSTLVKMLKKLGADDDVDN